MIDLERRRVATQKTLDRYRNKSFDWQRGITCVHLARYHLKQMGHKPETLPRIRSAFAAKKAMNERGWDSVTDMLDSMLPRITPARMKLGDLATVAGDSGFDSILICAGPFKMMGWHPDGSFVVYDGGNGKVEFAWEV